MTKTDLNQRKNNKSGGERVTKDLSFSSSLNNTFDEQYVFNYFSCLTRSDGEEMKDVIDSVNLTYQFYRLTFTFTDRLLETINDCLSQIDDEVSYSLFTNLSEIRESVEELYVGVCEGECKMSNRSDLPAAVYSCHSYVTSKVKDLLSDLKFHRNRVISNEVERVGSLIGMMADVTFASFDVWMREPSYN